MVNSERIHVYLCLLIALFFIASRAFSYSGETSFLEMGQALVLLIVVILNIKHRKSFSLAHGRKATYLRILAYLVLLYEEISFFTKDIFSFLSRVNYQSEFNLHNSLFLVKGTSISFFGFDFYLQLYVVLWLVVAMVLAFGRNVPFLGPLRLLCFEKEYMLYLSLYPIELVSLSKLNIFGAISGNKFLGMEYMEAFIYLVILLDTALKIKRAKVLGDSCFGS